MPGAWGVQWEDLTKLDYRHKGLWQFMAEVFLTWCRRGVDGFRCDAGYMIPHAAWKYIVARVREQFPDTTFLLEGLGGKIEVTRALLDTANLDWAYSELFQNYDRSQIERYLPEAIDISGAQGLTVHFAETHDNPRLAAASPVYARMRTALCALASHQGAFGFANGVEWLATEKIVVHEAHSLNWGAPVNQVAEIGRLTRLLKRHPAFHDRAEVRLIEQGDGNQIVILRHHPPTGKRLLVLVNLDPERPVAAVWDPEAAGLHERACTDLLTGAPVTVAESGGRFTCALAPGQVLCLSPEPADLELLERAGHGPFEVPPRIERQRLRATALGVFTHYQGVRDLGDFDPELAADRLFEDPVAFCAAMNPAGRESRVVTWQWPRDLRREVMLPPGHFLLVRGDAAFRVRLVDGERIVAAADSQRAADGSRFCLLAPPPAPAKPAELRLHLSVFTGNGARHEQAGLLLLPRAAEARVNRVYGRADLLERPMLFLDTNGSGAMLRAAVAWGTLTSRYDALIAANPDPDQPNDRWVMFSACRAWLVYQGYSADINLDCLQTFALAGRGGAVWRYKVPSGQGEHVLLEVGLAMVPGKNALRLVFSRDPAGEDPSRLADSKPVRLILRPDIESRSFHHTTKAFAGPEQHYRSAVATTPAGFVFQPDEHHRLALEISDGAFVQDPEWRYMVFRGMEAERGLDPDSDLFSPGYFEALLEGGRSVVLAAEAAAGAPPAPVPAEAAVVDDPPPKRAAVAPIEVLLPRPGSLPRPPRGAQDGHRRLPLVSRLGPGLPDLRARAHRRPPVRGRRGGAEALRAVRGAGHPAEHDPRQRRPRPRHLRRPAVVRDGLRRSGRGPGRRLVPRKRLRRPPGPSGARLDRARLPIRHPQRDPDGPRVGARLQPVPLHLDGHQFPGRHPAPGLPGRDPGALARGPQAHGAARPEGSQKLEHPGRPDPREPDHAFLEAGGRLPIGLPARGAGAAGPRGSGR